MTARFRVLASGSSGNAAVLAAESGWGLIDLGLKPDELTRRLARADSRPHAVILTHTHSDHWSDESLHWLLRGRGVAWCHADHGERMARVSPAYLALQAAGRVKSYDALQPFAPWPGVTAVAVPVRHDGGPTFAFRIDGPADLFGPSWSLGYVTDLGSWEQSLADRMANTDVLAVEFNHDEMMQRRSGRPYPLIARVLGDHGHLSNRQAADFVRAVVQRSDDRGPAALVALHRSRDCNTAEMVREAASGAVGASLRPTKVVLAEQNRATAEVVVSGAGGRKSAGSRKRRARNGMAEVGSMFESSVQDFSAGSVTAGR